MPKKKRKIYSREFKLEAVGLITKKGYSIAEAFDKNPNRFKGRVPVPKALSSAAWINKPATDKLESNLLMSVSHFH